MQKLKQDAMEVDDTEKAAATTATGRKIRTDYVPKGIFVTLYLLQKHLSQ